MSLAPYKNCYFPAEIARRPAASPRAHGFTLIEILMTVAILGIAALIGMDAIADSDANMRAERAARETVAAIRFARSRALSDGVSYVVRFDVNAKTISVVDPNNSYAVLAAPIAGSIMQINLFGQTDVANVAIAPAVAGEAANPYDVTYSANGGTSNYGTVSFTYGGKTKILQIPTVGDPTLVGDPLRP